MCGIQKRKIQCNKKRKGVGEEIRLLVLKEESGGRGNWRKVLKRYKLQF